MANRPQANPIAEASRRGAWALKEIGRELRIARIAAGHRQVDVARRLGTSPSRICGAEQGAIRSLSLQQVHRHAAAVGLRPFVRLYLAARRLLDQPQLDLIAAFRSRLAPSWTFATEVPVPIPGDLRPADARFALADCVCVGEAYTRISDFQAQSRAALAKKRDLGADRLVLIVLGTSANRQALRAAGDIVHDSFPIGTRDVLEALGEGRDPGGDAIAVMSVG